MSDNIGHEDQFAWMADLEHPDWNLYFDWAVYGDVAQERSLENKYPPEPAQCCPDGRFVTDLHAHHMQQQSISKDVSENSHACIQDATTIVTSEDRCNTEIFHVTHQAGSLEFIKEGRKAHRYHEQLRCPEPGCSHARTFPRKFELERHIAAKHGSQKSFTCPVPGCFKGTMVTRFARADKLTAHIRSAHSIDSLAKCPVDGCKASELPIDLLGRHIHLAHHDALDSWYYRNGYGSITDQALILKNQLQAVVHAADTTYRTCPYWRCGKKLRLSSFVDHLLSHSEEELDDFETQLNAEGYLLLRKLEHNEGGSIEGNLDSIDVGVKCPLCDNVLQPLDAFEAHLVSNHILRRDLSQHYWDWRKFAAKTLLGQTASGYKKSSPGAPWENWGCLTWDKKDPINQRICPHATCSYEFRRPKRDTNDDTIGAHHLSLLRSTEDTVAELYPFRRQILRLFPAFKTHPVFDDLA